jgi:hypothetical protein
MSNDTATTALKEWAVAVKALREGRQILLVRKGGIREETREFRIQARQFLLFPTYEHQRPDLLQPPFIPDLEQVLAAPRDPERVRIDTWAELTDLFVVTEPWQIEAVLPHYCWSVAYAEERLRWRPRKPLLVMAVRAYRLAEPREIRARPEYGGCKSWLSLPDETSLAGMAPALGDAEYAERVASVRAALDREPTGVGG